MAALEEARHQMSRWRFWRTCGAKRPVGVWCAGIEERGADDRRRDARVRS